MTDRQRYSGPCALEQALAVFAGRWKPALLYHLLEAGPLRHGELRRRTEGISQRIMTRNLRELERDGLVVRTELDGSPRGVQYEATELARTIRPIYVSIETWAAKHLDEVEASRESIGPGILVNDGRSD